MKLSSAFIKVNELVRERTEEFKRSVIMDAGFYGLTVNQLLYLETVCGLEDPALSDIANELNVSNASASNAIKKLMGEGFIKKERSEKDKRVYRICLTQKGENLVCAEKSAANAFWEGMIGGLSEEEHEALSSAFNKFLKS